MAQIVHDLAPGASLAFATAFTANSSFAKNIRELADAGAEVIVDDVFYTKSPSSKMAQSRSPINEVVARGDRLLLCRRQQQPDRQPGTQHRLLGSAGISRLAELPGAGGRTFGRNRSRARGWQRPQSGPLPGLRSRANERQHLRDHGQPRGNAWPWTSSGRNLVAGSAPTSMPSCSTPSGELCRDEHRRQRLGLGNPEAGGGHRMGKRYRRRRARAARRSTASRGSPTRD